MSCAQLWLSEPIPNDDTGVTGLELATLCLRALHPNHCAITAVLTTGADAVSPVVMLSPAKSISGMSEGNWRMIFWICCNFFPHSDTCSPVDSRLSKDNDFLKFLLDVEQKMSHWLMMADMLLFTADHSALSDEDICCRPVMASMTDFWRSPLWLSLHDEHSIFLQCVHLEVWPYLRHSSQL